MYVWLLMLCFSELSWGGRQRKGLSPCHMLSWYHEAAGQWNLWILLCPNVHNSPHHFIMDGSEIHFLLWFTGGIVVGSTGWKITYCYWDQHENNFVLLLLCIPPLLLPVTVISSIVLVHKISYLLLRRTHVYLRVLWLILVLHSHRDAIESSHVH